MLDHTSVLPPQFTLILSPFIIVLCFVAETMASCLDLNALLPMFSSPSAGSHVSIAPGSSLAIGGISRARVSVLYRRGERGENFEEDR